MSKVVVELFCTNGVALIIEHPTGIFYTQQCGGVACQHREVEGYCIPFSGNDEWKKFCEKTCEVGCFGGNLIKLESELPRLFYFNDCVKIDRSRLHLGTEAFIPVFYSGKKAWIMLPYNCD